MWGAIIPALAVKASRKKYGNPHYRVWGGDALVYLMMSYGGLLIVCYFLAAIEILPVY
jgi:tryptophan-specific transport protein